MLDFDYRYPYRPLLLNIYTYTKIFTLFLLLSLISLTIRYDDTAIILMIYAVIFMALGIVKYIVTEAEEDI
jgi:L-asparagine transporter-like permease